MAVDPQTIADCAAAKLKTDPADMVVFANMAIGYVRSDTGVPTLPDGDDLLNEGLCLLACRIYQDTPNPSAGLDSFDGFAGGTFVPRVLATHLDQYWLHINSYEVDEDGETVTKVPSNFRGIA